MNIDMHCHIVTEEMIRLMQGVSKQYAPVLEARGEPYPSGLTKSSRGYVLGAPGEGHGGPWPESGHNVELRLRDMERTGVDCQAVAPWPRMFFIYDIPKEVAVEFAKIQNEEAARLKRDHPGKFAPLATVPLQDGQAAADELQRAVTQLGLHGLATGTSCGAKPLDAEHLEPLYAKLNELNVPWFIHSYGAVSTPEFQKYYLNNFIGNPLETTIAVCSLIFGGVIERYPKIRCWTPHAGGYVPFQFGRYDHGYEWRPEPKAIIKKKPSEYLYAFKFDIIAHSKPALNYLVQAFGPERVYLGTDYPFDMGVADPIEAIEAIETTDEAGKALIRGGNAEAALRL